MKLIAFSLAACATIYACAISGTEAQEEMPKGEGGVSESLDYQAVLTAEPTTIEVQLEDHARRYLQLHLEQQDLGVVQLVLRDIRPERASTLKGVRLFIDKRDADPTTSVEDPHYAGSFVLGLEDRQSMLWNIAPTLSRIWKADEIADKSNLTVTFVPEPWDFAEELPQDFALRIGSLEVNFPQE